MKPNHLSTSLFFLLLTASIALPNQPSNDGTEAVQSPYSAMVLALRQRANLPPSLFQFPYRTPTEIGVAFYALGEDSLALLARHELTIKASVARVAGVIEAFEKYGDIFPGVKRVVPEKHGDRVLTEWEGDIPFPLVPNPRYALWYVASKMGNSRRYHYQLKKKGDLNFSDGLIVLTPSPDGKTTTYWELTFLSANFGLAGTFAPGNVRRKSVEGMLASDLSIKLRAENPDWPDARVKAEAEKLSENWDPAQIESRRPITELKGE